QGTGGVGAPPVFEGPISEGGCVANLGSSPWSAPRAKKALDLLRRRLQQRIGRMLVARNAEKTVTVEAENGRISIRLATSQIFGASQASVRPEALPVLDAVAEELRSLGRPIRVEGHTDDRAVSSERYANNWELSTARAGVVTAYLEAAHHFEPGKLSAAGFAATRPIAGNDTPEGRQVNRRLELVIELEPGDAMKLAAAQEITPTSVQ
ncbi:MAG TPA: flagellar motor protein MotB, partial [Myxococcales bacterium]|nr:flagellar motor protein MotB [Myxococcales bacterium]